MQTEHKRCLLPSQICKAPWSASKPIYHNVPVLGFSEALVTYRGEQNGILAVSLFCVVSLGRAAHSIMVVSLLRRQRHTFFSLHLPESLLFLMPLVFKLGVCFPAI
ncbi:hypothetical protein V6Z11_D02G227700 [Gossypium hirsutum]